MKIKFNLNSDAPHISFDGELDEHTAEYVRLNLDTLLAEFADKAIDKVIFDFAKLDLRVADVLSCERVPKSEKLLKFVLKVGEEERLILSGIAKYYEPEQLVGKKVIIIANLKPRKMMGIESKGMILSASFADDLELLTVEKMIAGATIG